MEGQITLAEYNGWKQDIKDRLNQTVENFIVIGYRLRQIEDTEAFREDGYKSLNEFAKAEFNLSSTTVSRFKSINRRFTVEGSGIELLPELQGFGYSKLQEMLNLSEEDCSLLTPQTTVKEMRELHKFNMGDSSSEPAPEAGRTELQECIWDFFSEPGRKVLLEEVMEALCGPEYGEVQAEKIAETISPAGYQTHRKGIVYLFMYDYRTGVTEKMMTSPKAVRMTWMEFLEEIRKVYVGYLSEEASVWENAYGKLPEEQDKEQIPGQMDITALEKEEIATSQQEIEPPAAVVEEKEESIQEEEEQSGERTEADIVTGVSVDAGVSGDALEPGDDAGDAAESEDAGGEPADSTGVAEGRGCEKDATEVEEDIWIIIRNNHQKLNQYLTLWGDQETRMEIGAVENLYRASVDMAAALERVMEVRRSVMGGECE